MPINRRQLQKQSSKFNLSTDNLDQGSLRKGILVCFSKETRLKLETIVNNLLLRVIISLLVLIDGTLVVFTLTSKDKKLVHNLKITSEAILWILCLDVVLDIIVKDLHYFKDKWNIIDFVVVTGCLAIEYAIPPDIGSKFRVLVFFRQIKLIRVLVNFCRLQRHLRKASQKAVSQGKRRYKKDGFDLDLSFITENLFAMSVPAVGKEAIYRNECDQVASFFKKKYEGNFHIYNLCPERQYNYAKFENEVYEWFMDDHNPPPLCTLIEFCIHVHRWLADPDHKDDERVAAVHCKGGKGRTGTMVCAYLLYSEYTAILNPDKPDDVRTIHTADDAMEWFTFRRTGELRSGAGVEVPSQKRYVQYIEQLLNVCVGENRPYTSLTVPTGPKIEIKKIRVMGVRKLIQEVRELKVVIRTVEKNQTTEKLYADLKIIGNPKEFDCIPCSETHIDYADFIPQKPIEVQDDVKVSFYGPNMDITKINLFGFWWHTWFEEGQKTREKEFMISFKKEDTDGIRHAIKKKKYENIFPRFFECQAFFTFVE